MSLMMFILGMSIMANGLFLLVIVKQMKEINDIKNIEDLKSAYEDVFINNTDDFERTSILNPPAERTSGKLVAAAGKRDKDNYRR